MRVPSIVIRSYAIGFVPGVLQIVFRRTSPIEFIERTAGVGLILSIFTLLWMSLKSYRFSGRASDGQRDRKYLSHLTVVYGLVIGAIVGALLPVYLTMLAEHLPSPFSSLSVHRIGIATFIQSILLGLGFGGFVGGLLYERLLLDIKQRKRLAVYGTLVLALSITPIIYHVPTFSTSVASSEELSPIEDAVWRDSIRDVRFLLNRGTPPSESERAEALGAAISIERADMVSAFVEAGTDINISGKWGYPLQNAVSKEHEAIIRILLEAGADTGLSTSKSSYPPLIKSARLGNLRILKLLLESHADIDI